MSDNKTTTISFIRHGQVYNPEKVIYGRLPGFGLSGLGKSQAEGTAEYLKNTSLTAIYSSPLLRARQTAEIIGKHHPHIKVQTTESINEVMFEFEGQPMANMASRNWDLYTGTKAPYEQPTDILNRIKPFLNTLRDAYPGQHIALVTHGDVIAFTLLWINDCALIPQNKHSLDNFGIVDDYPAPASLSTLIYKSRESEEKPVLQYVKPYDTNLEDRGVSPR